MVADMDANDPPYEIAKVVLKMNETIAQLYNTHDLR